jgi:hypothetical protein
VHDLPPHVDRRAVLLERPLDDLDGPLTPAQNDCGSARKIVRGAQASSQPCSTGAARRSERRAVIPRRSVPGWTSGSSDVSTIARTTAS